MRRYYRPRYRYYYGAPYYYGYRYYYVPRYYRYRYYYPYRYYYYRRPRSYRQCVDWYAVEHRPSGTVITPQMRCWWR